jgi:hypothetical protein
MFDVTHEASVDRLDKATHAFLKRPCMGDSLHITIPTLRRMLGSTAFGYIDSCARK